MFELNASFSIKISNYRFNPSLLELLGSTAQLFKPLHKQCFNTDKGRMIIPGKKLYLHGASDADWGGEDMSMKSTTGAYLALGDYGVVWSCSKLQKRVADSSTAA